jgi:GNAT superfamily N-acetyltransferase
MAFTPVTGSLPPFSLPCQRCSPPGAGRARRRRSSYRGADLPHGQFPKELHVTSSARSGGVGEQLIEGIRALARERGDTRVIWTTGEQNAGSQRFYARLGMRREKKVYFVMDV